MGNPFILNSRSKNFAAQKPWTFEVAGAVVEWRPEAPYLFPLNKDAEAVVDSVFDLFYSWTQSEGDGETFRATPTGPTMVSDLSNRHTALFFVNFLYPEWDEDNFQDAEDPDSQVHIKYSKTAPRLVTIFGPQDEGIIY